MNKIFHIAASVAVSLAVLTGCSAAYESGVTPTVSADETDSLEVLSALNEAQEITLEKKVLSLNDVYTVSADDVVVGEIRGQYIYLIGDTFSLFSNEGNLVGSEGEELRVVTNSAELFDWENNPTGEWQEHVSWPMKKWALIDSEGEKVAQANQKLSIALNFTIKDLDDEPQFEIKKSVISIGSRIAITKVAEEPAMEAIDALWLAAITNEIDEGERK